LFAPGESRGTAFVKNYEINKIIDILKKHFAIKKVMQLDFLELKTVYTLAHIFGAILGAGGAFASDLMFFSTIKDGRITNVELRFMRLGSRLVWVGLAVLIVSGILLVLTDPVKYLSSDKFLAKVTIVGFIIVNGIIFHLIHIPHIRNHLGVKFRESRTFIKRAPFVLASGALSFVSWVLAVTLGVIKNIPYSYTQIISAYLVIVLLAMGGSVAVKRFILRI
jgi:hypothetical protein